MGRLCTLSEVQELITAGRTLVLAGPYYLLEQLPRGNWVAGMTCRYVSQGHCCETLDKIFLFDLSETINQFWITSYHAFSLEALYRDPFPHGFSILVMPAFSRVHRYFTLHSGMQIRGERVPYCGWVSGISRHVGEFREPVVIDGYTHRAYTDRVVVMHCALPYSLQPQVHLVTPHTAGPGDRIEFDTMAFVVEEVIVNGERRLAPEYFSEAYAGGGMRPLVTTLRGLPVSVSPLPPIGERSVTFATAVIPGLEYRIAQRLEEDPKTLCKSLSQEIPNEPLLAFYCNENYESLSLAGTPYSRADGIFTHGEVASVMFNSTSVYLSIQPSILSTGL